MSWQGQQEAAGVCAERCCLRSHMGSSRVLEVDLEVDPEVVLEVVLQVVLEVVLLAGARHAMLLWVLTSPQHRFCAMGHLQRQSSGRAETEAETEAEDGGATYCNGVAVAVAVAVAVEQPLCRCGRR